MAAARPQFPGHPRSHSFGYTSNAPSVSNTTLPAIYECYTITPSEARDEDLTSQDRWTRAHRTRSAATEKDLEATIDIQRHSERKAQEDLRSISVAKHGQIIDIIEGRQRSNPGFTYHLVALKLEQGYVKGKSSSRKQDHKHIDSKKSKKSTASMQIVLQRKSGLRQGVIPLTAGCPTTPGTASSNSSADRTGRTPGVLVTKNLPGSHTHTSMPQYLPPYLRTDQRLAEEISAPATQNQVIQQVHPPTTTTTSRRRESNRSQELYPLPSSSSSSLDSAESSPPRRMKSTIYHIGSNSLLSQHSVDGNSQPLEPKASLLTPRPSASTPRGQPYGQAAPNQSVYQQSRHVQPRSEYPFPSVPPCLYVSTSTQTDTSFSDWGRFGGRASGKSLDSIYGDLPKAYENGDNDGVGDSVSKAFPYNENDTRVIEESDPNHNSSGQPQRKGSRNLVNHEKPAWMNNLVPVTPPAIAECLPSIPRRSNPMSPIVEDSIDVSEDHNKAIGAGSSDEVERPEHVTDLHKPAEIQVNVLAHTSDSGEGEVQKRIESPRRPLLDHRILRSDKQRYSDTKNTIPSLCKSGSYERPNSDTRRGSGPSTAEVEYFSLRPNDYAEDKPRSPNKRVTFSLPPSPLCGPDSRSTSPGETPPSSPRSGPGSPTIKLSAPAYPLQPLPSRQRSSYNESPSNPVIIEGPVCRPPLHRQSQSSFTYRPKERSPPRAENGNLTHLSSAPASLVDLERHDKNQGHEMGKNSDGDGHVRYEHVCPYASCKGLAFNVKEDRRNHVQSAHKRAGRR